MEGFEWAQANLDAESPHALQEERHPGVFRTTGGTGTQSGEPRERPGGVFQEDAPQPKDGYFAEEVGLERYCERKGIPFSETDGLASTLSRGREAGDPLKRGR